MTAASMIKSEAIAFGIRVDGRDVGIKFRTAIEAKDGATCLCDRGYRRLTVFDRVSGRDVTPEFGDATVGQEQKTEPVSPTAPPRIEANS